VRRCGNQLEPHLHAGAAATEHGTYAFFQAAVLGGQYAYGPQGAGQITAQNHVTDLDHFDGLLTAVSHPNSRTRRQAERLYSRDTHVIADRSQPLFSAAYVTAVYAAVLRTTNQRRTHKDLFVARIP
jgi:hypothetical protein